MAVLFSKRPLATELLPVRSRITIVGGSYKGHGGEVLGVTAQMNHVRLDSQKITKIKHNNARELISSSSVQLVRPIEPIHSANQDSLIDRMTRLELTDAIQDSLEVIDQHRRRVSKCAARLCHL